MCHAVVAAGTQHSHARHVLGQLLRRFTLCSVAVVTESLRRSVCVCMYPDGIIQGPLLLKDDSSLSLFFVSRFYLVFHPLTFSLHHFIVPIAPIMHSFLYHFLLLHCSHFSNRTSVPLSFPIFSWTLSITVCSFLSFIAVATKEFLLPCVIFCISVAKQSLYFHSHHWFF